MRAVGGQERRRIGADGEEGDEAEVEQPGEADLEVEAHAHQHVEPDEHEHLADEVPRHEREQQQHQGAERDSGHANAGALSARQPLEATDDTIPNPHPQGDAGGDDDDDGDRSLELEGVPSEDRRPDGFDGPLVLQHELDEVLKQADESRRHEADHERSPHGSRHDVEQPAEHGEQRAAGDQHRHARGSAVTEGEHLEQRGLERDEDEAQLEQAHDDDEQRQQTARKGADGEGSRHDRGHASRRRLVGDVEPGAQCDEHEDDLAQGEAIGEYPTLVEHGEDADRRDIDGDAAEEEAGGYGALERRLLLFAFPIARCDYIECHANGPRRSCSGRTTPAWRRAARRGSPAAGRSAP